MNTVLAILALWASLIVVLLVLVNVAKRRAVRHD